MQERQQNRALYFRELAATSERYFLPYIERFRPVEAGMRVLEIGCGDGGNLLPFARRGCVVTGVDMAATRIDDARRFFAEAGAEGTFIASDIFLMKDLEASFDLIVCHDVLEHIGDPDMGRAASEIRRVLRPGGYAFVRSFTPSDMRSGTRSGEGIRYVHRNPDGIVRFFTGFSTEYARRVDEPTRFGTVRSRAECLFRKPLE